ncbi:MAG: GspE/PulE family protein [Candidatus Falkowbacteria bacterium]|nr:GspE/PulE family protein [Candidatus Falkowbacteria bacterium]
MNRKEQLLSLLRVQSLISAEQQSEISAMLAQADFDLNDYLIKSKIIDEEKLYELWSAIYSLPYFNAISTEISRDDLGLLPQDIARNYNIVCLGKEGKFLKFGITDPNLKAMEAVNFLAQGQKLNPKYFIISHSGMDKILKEYQQIEEEISSALEEKTKEEGGEDLIQLKSGDDETLNVSDADINSAPVAKIVSAIIRHAVEARASDIHIEPYEKESRVRYRIDGILHTSLTLPKSIHNSVIARIKVLAKLKLDESRIPQDGRIRLLVDGKDIDFRVSTLPLSSSEKVVMRILDSTKGAPALEDLGFNKVSMESINRSIKKTNGIILVSGPTGSGKSTTLYAILTLLNQEGVNISTLEDPVEYEIKGINQSQIRPKIGFTFANGLRSLLRQDPNIIMVGEIRDEETAELAIQASLTGHLVLSSIHTNDALGAVFRLEDMKAERFLISSTLRALIAQRLVRQICPHCRQEKAPSPAEISSVQNNLNNLKDEVIRKELPDWQGASSIGGYKFYSPVGCPRCENTGFLGRTSIAEAIEVSDKIREIIADEKKTLNLDVVRETQDFISVQQDGIIKVLKGITTIEEVLRVVEA